MCIVKGLFIIKANTKWRLHKVLWFCLFPIEKMASSSPISYFTFQNSAVNTKDQPIVLAQLSEHGLTEVSNGSGQPAYQSWIRGRTSLLGQSGDLDPSKVPRWTLLGLTATSDAESRSSITGAHPPNVQHGQAASLETYPQVLKGIKYGDISYLTLGRL